MHTECPGRMSAEDLITMHKVAIFTRKIATVNKTHNILDELAVSASDT